MKVRITMAGELAVNKMRIRLNVPIVLAMKVVKTFSTGLDRKSSTAFVRALEEACRDCVLTKKDYAQISKIVEMNRNERIKRRYRQKLRRQEALAEAARSSSLLMLSSTASSQSGKKPGVGAKGSAKSISGAI